MKERVLGLTVCSGLMVQSSFPPNANLEILTFNLLRNSYNIRQSTCYILSIQCLYVCIYIYVYIYIIYVYR